MIKLENSVTLYVPKESNEGHALNFETQLNFLTSLFGGSTTTTAEGKWVDGDGKAYVDRLDLVQFNYGEATPYIVTTLMNTIITIIKQGQQLAVSVNINGTLYIFENTDGARFVEETLKSAMNV